MDQEVTRNDRGQYVKGQSGNPAGRPKGRKNELTELKQDLEIAVRKNVKPDDIKNIVQRMVDEALSGSVGAAKLILDKVLSNARDGDDAPDIQGGITIRIENLTQNPEKEVTGVVIENTEES